MFNRLDDIEEKYNSLTDELMKPENVNDIKKMTVLSKERAELESVVKEYQNYKQLLKSIEDTKDLLNDPELGAVAKEELASLEAKKSETEGKLEYLLIPKDPNDGKNVIVEIRGAAGGDEANIFAGDLYEMYTKYALNMGWKHEIINSFPGEAGGYTQIEMIIKGDNVYSKLKYESGSHRVQRVPTTETQGRVHTSTATVIVLPEQEETDVEIKEQDLKIDVYRSSGAGGQSVNTTDSAVRITHLPTNIVVTCQNERSQIKNKEKAMQILKNKIYEEAMQKKAEELGEERRSKVGSGDRSEKIRTYNYPQNRVTDHRINLTVMQLDRIMQGKLDEIIEPLIAEDLRLKLEGQNNEI